MGQSRLWGHWAFGRLGFPEDEARDVLYSC